MAPGVKPWLPPYQLCDAGLVINLSGLKTPKCVHIDELEARPSRDLIPMADGPSGQGGAGAQEAGTLDAVNCSSSLLRAATSLRLTGAVSSSSLSSSRHRAWWASCWSRALSQWARSRREAARSRTALSLSTSWSSSQPSATRRQQSPLVSRDRLNSRRDWKRRGRGQAVAGGAGCHRREALAWLGSCPAPTHPPTHPDVHPALQQTLTTRLLCARHSSGCQRHNVNKTDSVLAPRS